MRLLVLLSALLCSYTSAHGGHGGKSVQGYGRKGGGKMVWFVAADENACTAGNPQATSGKLNQICMGQQSGAEVCLCKSHDGTTWKYMCGTCELQFQFKRQNSKASPEGRAEFWREKKNELNLGDDSMQQKWKQQMASTQYGYGHRYGQKRGPAVDASQPATQEQPLQPATTGQPMKTNGKWFNKGKQNRMESKQRLSKQNGLRPRYGEQYMPATDASQPATPGQPLNQQDKLQHRQQKKSEQKMRKQQWAMKQKAVQQQWLIKQKARKQQWLNKKQQKSRQQKAQDLKPQDPNQIPNKPKYSKSQNVAEQPTQDSEPVKPDQQNVSTPPASPDKKRKRRR
jgi:hypothetical protein